MYKINDKIIAFLPPDTIEKEALEQLTQTSQLSIVYPHIAVMPDCHCGKGSTVGSVIATKGAVIPAAVGVDIGCGMIAVKTTLKSTDKWNTPDNLKNIRLGIERRVPMSMGKFKSSLSESAKLRVKELEETPGVEMAERISPNWRLQLGTLGGGNHFIELCVDTEDNIWATLHSGSRGVGNKIGNYYIKKAQEICELHHIQLPHQDLAYLSENTPEFNEYIRDLRWAQKFALLNREEMLDCFMMELATITLGDYSKFKELEFERINCHHNFTQIENHLNHNIWVTRKGAIQAKEGMKGMIPGSMGTKSYIVSGLENKMSFASAPHGAGRRFSRTKAREQFTMEDFDKAMIGIEHRRTEILLDEIPQAYKDIDEVMENAKELVKVDAILKQILNVKGD